MELQVNDLFAKIGVLTMENDMLKARIAELEKPQVAEPMQERAPNLRAVKNVTEEQ